MSSGGMFDLRFRFCRDFWLPLRLDLESGGNRQSGLDCGRAGFRFSLCLANRPDHVERALRVVFEFIAMNALTTVQRVLEADELSCETGELFGRKKRLGEKTLQPAGAHHHVAVLWRKLLQTEHGNDILKVGVLRERAPDLLRQAVMPFADYARRRHLGIGL